jgi:drug/metabolite transporter (DMT)-like permease
VSPDQAKHPATDAELHLPWWMWIVPALWAGAFLTGASALLHLSADTVSFLRFAITIAGGAVVFRGPIRTVVRARPTVSAWLALALLAAVGGVAYHLLFYLGLARARPPIASVVIATNPMLTALGCAIFLRDRKPTVALLVGLTLAFAGAVCIAADQPSRSALGESTWFNALSGWGLGETLCLLASLSWATYAVLLQHFRGGLLNGLTSAGVTYFVYLITTVLLLPIVVASGGVREIPSMTANEWSCLLYLGLIATVIAYTLYNAAIDRVGSARASQVTYAVPTLTTVLSMVFVEYVPGRSAVLGLVLVTVGLVVSDGRIAASLRSRFART